VKGTQVRLSIPKDKATPQKNDYEIYIKDVMLSIGCMEKCLILTAAYLDRSGAIQACHRWTTWSSRKGKSILDKVPVSVDISTKAEAYGSSSQELRLSVILL